MSSTRPVNMRLSKTLLDRVDLVVEKTGAKNRTEVISYMVSVMCELTNSLSSGDSVFIEKKDGSKERLIIPRY